MNNDNGFVNVMILPPIARLLHCQVETFSRRGVYFNFGLQIRHVVVD